MASLDFMTAYVLWFVSDSSSDILLQGAVESMEKQSK